MKKRLLLVVFICFLLLFSLVFAQTSSVSSCSKIEKGVPGQLKQIQVNQLPSNCPRSRGAVCPSQFCNPCNSGQKNGCILVSSTNRLANLLPTCSDKSTSQTCSQPRCENEKTRIYSSCGSNGCEERRETCVGKCENGACVTITKCTIATCESLTKIKPCDPATGNFKDPVSCPEGQLCDSATGTCSTSVSSCSKIENGVPGQPTQIRGNQLPSNCKSRGAVCPSNFCNPCNSGQKNGCTVVSISGSFNPQAMLLPSCSDKSITENCLLPSCEGSNRVSYGCGNGCERRTEACPFGCDKGNCITTCTKTKCGGSKLYQCNTATGAYVKPPIDCATDNRLCDETTGSCVPKCTASKCEGNKLSVCDKTTGKYNAPLDCANNVCDEGTSSCIAKCTIATCQGVAAILPCDTTTGNFKDPVSCPEGQLCDPFAGTTIGLCKPRCTSSGFCRGNAGRTCDSSTGQFGPPVQCKDTEVCDSGTGKCELTCTKSKCDGSKLYQCNTATGAYVKPPIDCATDNRLCDETTGSCVPKCTASKCEGNKLSVCDKTTGKYNTPLDCVNNVCDEGTSSCIAKCTVATCQGVAAILPCDTTTGKFKDPVSCPEGQLCDSATGTCSTSATSCSKVEKGVPGAPRQMSQRETRINGCNFQTWTCPTGLCSPCLTGDMIGCTLRQVGGSFSIIPSCADRASTESCSSPSCEGSNRVSYGCGNGCEKRTEACPFGCGGGTCLSRCEATRCEGNTSL